MTALRRLLRTSFIGCLTVTVTLLCGCSQKTEQAPADTSEPSDIISEPGYTALGDSVNVQDTTSDGKAAERMARLIELFPRESLIDDSFESHDSAFVTVPGLDNVLVADYMIDGVAASLFVTEDRSGAKYLALVEFAASQSQVRPAPLPFDAGFSVTFNHRSEGRVLGGLKAGYLVGIVGYREGLIDFADRWVSVIQ